MDSDNHGSWCHHKESAADDTAFVASLTSALESEGESATASGVTAPVASVQVETSVSCVVEG